MDSEDKNQPYKGLWIFIIMMSVPSALLTLLFYAVISLYQREYGFELNFASAKILGCGVGMLYHISCMILGVFTKDFLAVAERLKEFVLNIFIYRNRHLRVIFKMLSCLEWRFG